MRQLPEQKERVETGVVCFGDDWPGVFVRGDDCFGYLLALESVLDGSTDVIAREMVKELAQLLGSSKQGG